MNEQCQLCIIQMDFNKIGEYGIQFLFFLMNTTEKKSPQYFYQRQRRFTRKTTERSQRSIDERRSSRQQIHDNKYLKTPKGSHVNFKDFVHDGDFFSQLASRLRASSNKNDQTATTPLKGSRVSKDNYVARLQTLEGERQMHQQQLQLAKQQTQNIRTAFHQEKQRRRKVQSDKKQINKQLSSLKKQFQKNEIQRKRIDKQKQYLIKQIQFLEKINFDEKTRTLQSYRQKYLQVQLQKVRDTMNKSKAARQKRLEEQVLALKQEKYTLQSHFKAVKISNECLLKQLAHCTQDNKDFVINSEEYIKLRQKYKKFLDEYKHLRAQYWSLKNQVHAGNHESSQLSITFSSTDEGAFGKHYQ